jgi:myo-inositol-1(or 4)-monophosphatase
VSRGPKREWDVCAGTLLVAEAGGRTTDLAGGAPRFNRATPLMHGILATNGALHESSLRATAELPPRGA